MITIEKAVSWLNYDRPGNLSKNTDNSLQEIKKSHSAAETDYKLEKLVTVTSNAAVYPLLEHAEVLVVCGAIAYQQSQHGQAYLYFSRANTIYESLKDPLRQSAALWAMGIIEWQRLDNQFAHSHSHTARRLMEELSCRPFTSKDGKPNWYLERFNEINEELTATVEEGYSWLTQFDGSKFTPPTNHVVDAIHENLRLKRYGQVNHMITSLQDMVRNSSDRLESAQVLAFLGMVTSQMGNYRESCRLLRQSVSQYIPSNHHCTCARWMLGMVHFQHGFDVTQAVTECNKAMSSMAQLKARAEADNNPVERDWYAARYTLMEKVLKNKMNCFTN